MFNLASIIKRSHIPLCFPLNHLLNPFYYFHAIVNFYYNQPNGAML